MVYVTEVGVDVEKAKILLDSNEIVAIPTETVYGLAANAFSEKAIEKVYLAKDRPSNNPLIVHVASKDRIYDLASNISEKAELLMEQFMPGPLTLLLPKKQLVPNRVTSGLPEVAIRMPNHPIAIKLLARLDYPLVAPSANPSGFISPTTTQHVYGHLRTKIPYILEGGQCIAGIESTIIGFRNEMPIIYRLGSISVAQIEQTVGKVVVNSDYNVQLVPGMLKKHYSPLTTLLLSEDVDGEIDKYSSKYIGLLTYDGYSSNLPMQQQIVLGSTKNMGEIAYNLYAALHNMDNAGYELIIVKKLPDEGIGKSINDRLIRAASI